jgi:NADH-ubiquinone oxidoreductase chain 5
LLRFYPFLKLSQTFHFFIIIIAISTILIAGIAAIAETDIKKIIALSTLSQLGVIISRIAIILPNLAFFHLITHALFKALLFISAGTLISLHSHSQDLRQIGNLTKQIPLSISCILTANLALCGFPFLAGFYSKDIILESFTFLPNINFFIINVLFLATIFTSAYTSRLIITTIISQNISIPINITNDLNKNNTTPIIVLTTGAITGGAITNWLLPITNHDPIISPFSKSLPIISTLTGA